MLAIQSRKRSPQAGGAVTMGVLRRFFINMMPVQRRAWRILPGWLASAGFLDPEFAPSRRAYGAIDERAGIWRLKQRATAALLISLG